MTGIVITEHYCVAEIINTILLGNEQFNDIFNVEPILGRNYNNQKLIRYLFPKVVPNIFYNSFSKIQLLNMYFSNNILGNDTQ